MTREEFVAIVRRENPELAAFVDAIKEAFPGARVSYLTHGTQSIGSPMTGTAVFPSPYPVAPRETQPSPRSTPRSRRR